MSHPTSPNHVPWIDGITCGDCVYCHNSPHPGVTWCVGPIPTAWQGIYMSESFIPKVTPENRQASECPCFVLKEE